MLVFLSGNWKIHYDRTERNKHRNKDIEMLWLLNSSWSRMIIESIRMRTSITEPVDCLAKRRSLSWTIVKRIDEVARCNPRTCTTSVVANVIDDDNGMRVVYAITSRCAYHRFHWYFSQRKTLPATKSKTWYMFFVSIKRRRYTC